jgi:hypothetical protein
MRGRHPIGRMEPLSEADRRLVAVRAADATARVPELFEAEAPCDGCPHDALAGLQVFARGEFCVRQVLTFASARAGAREVTAPESCSRRTSRRERACQESLAARSNLVRAPA